MDHNTKGNASACLAPDSTMLMQPFCPVLRRTANDSEQCVNLHINSHEWIMFRWHSFEHCVTTGFNHYFQWIIYRIPLVRLTVRRTEYGTKTWYSWWVIAMHSRHHLLQCMCRSRNKVSVRKGWKWFCLRYPNTGSRIILHLFQILVWKPAATHCNFRNK